MGFPWSACRFKTTYRVQDVQCSGEGKWGWFLSCDNLAVEEMEARLRLIEGRDGELRRMDHQERDHGEWMEQKMIIIMDSR